MFVQMSKLLMTIIVKFVGGEGRTEGKREEFKVSPFAWLPVCVNFVILSNILALSCYCFTYKKVNSALSEIFSMDFWSFFIVISLSLGSLFYTEHYFSPPPLHFSLKKFPPLPKWIYMCKSICITLLWPYAHFFMFFPLSPFL